MGECGIFWASMYPEPVLILAFSVRISKLHCAFQKVPLRTVKISKLHYTFLTVSLCMYFPNCAL